jgi:hypothetical protein
MKKVRFGGAVIREGFMRTTVLGNFGMAKRRDTKRLRLLAFMADDNPLQAGELRISPVFSCTG